MSTVRPPPSWARPYRIHAEGLRHYRHETYPRDPALQALKDWPELA